MIGLGLVITASCQPLVLRPSLACCVLNASNGRYADALISYISPLPLLLESLPGWVNVTVCVCVSVTVPIIWMLAADAALCWINGDGWLIVKHNFCLSCWKRARLLFNSVHTCQCGICLTHLVSEALATAALQWFPCCLTSSPTQFLFLLPGCLGSHSLMFLFISSSSVTGDWPVLCLHCWINALMFQDL